MSFPRADVSAFGYKQPTLSIHIPPPPDLES